jgi:hypothetical protein
MGKTKVALSPSGATLHITAPIDGTMQEGQTRIDRAAGHERLCGHVSP